MTLLRPVGRRPADAQSKDIAAVSSTTNTTECHHRHRQTGSTHLHKPSPPAEQISRQMNTVKSFWIGWGALIIAGGGAYYYAKRDIDASRREKFRKLQYQQQLNANLEYDTRTGGISQHLLHSRTPDHDLAFAPSEEATADPAPTRHEPDTNSQRDVEKSKYEAAVPYRSRKGDRFS